jgi:dolichol-phosphate mannosyltransferase
MEDAEIMISVVIPAHNEAANLPKLIEEVQESLEGKLEYEIIVVDDASTDETPHVLKQLFLSHQRLRCVRHSACCGQSASLMTGIDFAGGDVIGTLDGDGQNDPGDLPQMVQLLRNGQSQGVAMIAGHRQRRQDNLMKRFSSWVANSVRSRLLRDGTPDSGCGIKVFTRTAFLRLPRFHHMHRFLPALIRRDGGQVVSAAVNHRPRVSGKSHYGTLDRLLAGIVDLCGVIWLMRRSRLVVLEKEYERT